MSTTNPSQSVTVNPSRLQILMNGARRARRFENFCNIGKFIGVLFVLWTVVALLLHDDIVATTNFLEISFGAFWLLFGGFFWALFAFVINLLFQFSFQCGFLIIPLLLYLWAGVWTVRQRTILSLIQTSAETNTPLADMIKAYASGCYSSRFRKRLHRFAAALEQGYSLEQAVNLNPGLVRYDILAMLRLGGNEPTTLQTMEDSVREERSYSPIKGMFVFRAIYFFSLIIPLVLVVTFMMIKITPQFEAIFDDFGTELPVLTKVIFDLSVFCGYFILPLLPLLIIAVVLFLIMQMDVVTWRPFGFRKMFRNKDSAKMLRLLSIGLKRQLSLPDVITAYLQVVPSRYLQWKALQTQRDIWNGHDWIKALRRQHFVTSPEASLLETAQRTGNVPMLLEQLAVSKERTQLRKDDLTSKLVFIPCLLGLGAVIGVFVIAMFLPLVKLVQDLS